MACIFIVRSQTRQHPLPPARPARSRQPRTHREPLSHLRLRDPRQPSHRSRALTEPATFPRRCHLRKRAGRRARGRRTL